MALYVTGEFEGPIVVDFVKEKETKNTVVYRAVDGDDADVTTLYVQKTAFGDKSYADEFTMTLTVTK